MATKSNIMTPFGEIVPLDEWLTEIEPAWDALGADGPDFTHPDRKAFVQARWDALADGDERKNTVTMGGAFQTSRYFSVPVE